MKGNEGVETQTIQARFSSQEQAESAVRKLASLRGDCLRVERTSGSAPSFDSEMAADWDAPAESFGWSNEPANPQAGAFTLSANVPVMAAEQARTVVQESGGQIV